jgi:hypothetical protein
LKTLINLEEFKDIGFITHIFTDQMNKPGETKLTKDINKVLLLGILLP